jgi:hypothetical protein
MIKRVLSITAVILLSGCASLVEPSLVSGPDSDTSAGERDNLQLEDLGPAPELSGSIWLNTNDVLTSADFEGKVLLIDFWTFG